MSANSITYIDLFAGAGGLSEGFTASGYQPVAHVEMNEAACYTLKTRACYYYLKDHDMLQIYKNYLTGNITRDELYASVPAGVTDTVIHRTMARTYMPELFSEIRKCMAQQKTNHIDMIVDGPPCQAYSIIGRARQGNKVVTDPRNYLYKLYIQVLEEFRPKMFVFENVAFLIFVVHFRKPWCKTGWRGAREPSF